ncbi:MAG TPA: ABC transporter permease [Polyangia bacterium]
MGTFLADLKYGARLLWRTPAVSFIAVLTLALGIGANTAIFSVVHAVVMKPLPYRQPDRLVELYTQFPTMGFDRFWFSSPELLDLTQEARSFESIGGYQMAGAPVIGGEMPVRAVTAYCTVSLLPTLGVEPQLGRFPVAGEDTPDHPQTVLLSDGLWRRLFAADPAIVGRTIRVDSGPVKVAGVMPPGFKFPGEGTELWVPFGLKGDEERRGSHNWSVIARLKPGVTPAQAMAELRALEAAWKPLHKHAISDQHPMALHPLMGEIVGTLRSPLIILQGAVLLVLLIACANISGLLLARAESRGREIAIRMALGAGRRRLARQLLTESLVVGVLGGVGGLLLAAWALDLMLSLVPHNAPRMSEVHIDGAVLAFTAGAALLTSVVFGLAPVLHLAGGNVQAALAGAATRSSTGGAGRQRFRRALTVLEIALAVVLVVGSGLMIKSFERVLHVDAGIAPHGLFTFEIELPEREDPTNESAVALWQRLEERMATLPSVRAATVASGLPPLRQLNANDVMFEGKTPTKDGPAFNVDFFNTVGDGYFETMGIRLVEGRWFDAGDTGDSMPVVIINEQLARRFYPGEDPVGKRLRAGGDKSPWLTIVGVAGDVKQQGIDTPTGTELYLQMRQLVKAYPHANRVMSVILRSDLANPRSLERAAREAVGAIDPVLAVAHAATMDERLYDAVAKPRFVTTLLGALAGLALVLAAIGIYGVMAYSVAQRTRELGIRMALGAEPARVRRMVLGEGLRLGVAGIALGTAAALAVNLLLRRALVDLLFQVSAVDPATFAGVLALMLAVAGFACWWPARRATRVDPMVALRED